MTRRFTARLGNCPYCLRWCGAGALAGAGLVGVARAVPPAAPLHGAAVAWFAVFGSLTVLHVLAFAWRLNRTLRPLGLPWPARVWQIARTCRAFLRGAR